MERSVSRVRPATGVPSRIRQDIDIIAAVADRVVPGLFEDVHPDPESVFEEIRELTAGTAADVSGISYGRLDSELAVRWPAPDADSAGGYRYVDGDGWSFPTESGRARFSASSHEGLAEPTDEAYPLTLTTGRREDAYNTGVRSRGGGTDAPPVARLNPETLEAHCDSPDRGRTVIESRRAAVTVEVESTDDVPPGVVWLPIHHPSVNALTLPDVDPDSAEPNLKQCAVAVGDPDSSGASTAEGRPIRRFASDP